MTTSDRRVGGPPSTRQGEPAHPAQQLELHHGFQFDNIQGRDPHLVKWEQIDRLRAIGWAQFPCWTAVDGMCACGNAGCSARAKHPMVRNGVKDATTDREQLWAWHSLWPDANWALATGAPSGLFVIDIDPRHGGDASFEEWEMSQRGVTLPVTTQVLTGGQGMHLMYSYPVGRRVLNRTNWLPGVDVKSDGGYVILPGSRHASGGSYEWVDPNVGLAVAPDALLEAIEVRSRRRGKGSGHASEPTRSLQAMLTDGLGQPGERDNNCYRLACSLWRKYWNNAELVEAIIGDCWRMTPQGDKPFTWAEARAKIAGAREYVGEQIEKDRAAALALFGGVR